MDLWEQEDIDMVAPGLIERGETTRAASGLSPSKDGSTGETLPATGAPGAEFTWEGFDEGDPCTDHGWAVLEEGGRCPAMSTSISAPSPGSNTAPS